jgi:hypothetical protein
MTTVTDADAEALTRRDASIGARIAVQFVPAGWIRPRPNCWFDVQVIAVLTFGARTLV